MAVTIKQTESTPDQYPAIPDLTTAAKATDVSVIWSRIEAYIAHRFSQRDVQWTVEGPGEWCPPLTPAAIETVEVWSGAGEWESVTLDPSPLGGYWLPATGPYRFSGTVGEPVGSPDYTPPAVLEAARRLGEYFVAKAKAGTTSERVTAGSITTAYERSASWMGEALQNSGAADLLRPYRRA